MRPAFESKDDTERYPFSISGRQAERDHVVRADQEIASQNTELVPLTSDTLDAAVDLQAQYETLNVFDGVQPGSAGVLEEPIVATDTLFPVIPELEHIDPCNFG